MKASYPLDTAWSSLFCFFALSACACSSGVAVTSYSPTSFMSLRSILIQTNVLSLVCLCRLLDIFVCSCVSAAFLVYLDCCICAFSYSFWRCGVEVTGTLNSPPPSMSLCTLFIQYSPHSIKFGLIAHPAHPEHGKFAHIDGMMRRLFFMAQK